MRRAELAPEGVLQLVLAWRVAVAAWRLASADRVETGPFEERRWEDGGFGLVLIRGPRVYPEDLARARSKP